MAQLQTYQDMTIHLNWKAEQRAVKMPTITLEELQESTAQDNC